MGSKAVEVLVDESFIVPEVKIGFNAVLGDIHLTVLVGTHRARSTLIYGSSFCATTRYPRALSRRPSEAAVMPLLSPDTTPPVAKIYFVCFN